MQLDIKTANKILHDVFNPFNGKIEKLNTENTHTGIPDDHYDGRQGEYNENTTYYRHPGLPENIFVSVVRRTDSYNENEHIHSIQFVEGKPKTVTIYEPV